MLAERSVADAWAGSRARAGVEGPTSMIGVAADPTDAAAAAEFFELFKTPWQPATPGRRYRVVVGTGASREKVDADVCLLFGSGEQPFDRAGGVRVRRRVGPIDVVWGGSTFPLYGSAALFEAEKPFLHTAEGAVGYVCRDGNTTVYRLGYDLFSEVRSLLNEGQPARNALIPTLELHIGLVRHLLLESGIPVLEISPRPYGYDFISCLTHDVDFYGIRRHKLDLTLAGFMARASIGTLMGLVRGRRSIGEAVRNWTALASLPLVFARLAPDFWQPLRDYARIEPEGDRSTFFMVPFKGRPGVSPSGSVDARRAVRYGVDEVRSEVEAAVERGSEVAVHGIDAWRDVEAGRAELRQVLSVTGKSGAGVRMHWLYFDQKSPERLESAGFEYDSTWGYNDAVGYRAGTSQVFRWLSTERLLELPLSIMDSALFFRRHMNLSADEALGLCRQLLVSAERFGGTMVVNWHDRSLVPERLWSRCYQQLLRELQTRRAWQTTAAQAVEWYRWRRSIAFVEQANGDVLITAPRPCRSIPAATVRIHRPARPAAVTDDCSFDGRDQMSVTL